MITDHPGQGICVFKILMELYHQKEKQWTNYNYKEKNGLVSSVNRFGGMSYGFRLTVSRIIY